MPGKKTQKKKLVKKTKKRPPAKKKQKKKSVKRTPKKSPAKKKKKKLIKRKPKKSPAKKKKKKLSKKTPPEEKLIPFQPIVARRKPSDAVYRAYEQALSLLHNKRYKQAQQRLTRVVEAFPEDIEIIARARSFLRVCEKQLKSTKEESTNTAEEVFDQAVFYHNAGQYEQALEEYARALKLSTQSKDHIYYAMAATELSMGNTVEALKHLEKAIQMNQENRFFAHNDPDFAILSTNKEFQELIHPD